jgi:hypothetical protein
LGHCAPTLRRIFGEHSDFFAGVLQHYKKERQSFDLYPTGQIIMPPTNFFVVPTGRQAKTTMPAS